MHLSRLIIRGFRNFQDIDVPLAGNVVLLGENRVGKSNFLYAIRLVMDPTLPDSARQLKLSDLWDGAPLAEDSKIEIHLDFANFDDDPALVALLTDLRTAGDPAVARLSYLFRKKPEVVGIPASGDDFEFLVFGGGDETRPIPYRVRKRIAIDMLDALRDAEGQLASWRNSPLRPLLEEAMNAADRAAIAGVANDLNEASQKLVALPTVQALEQALRADILGLAGAAHDINARLRFAPADPQRLFRSIAMFIDGGRRGIADASLGSANVALIALKLAEFDWRRRKNDRNYSLLCIEEPEAHLHPQLQRSVFKKLFREMPENQATIVTSHSPTLAAVVPPKSIVHLTQTDAGTAAHSLAKLPVTPDELEDIERYLNSTRAEILFSRGVIFVEGDAEEALLPGFARLIGTDLDEIGVTVCNVGGTHFTPYVKLAASLGLPYVVITDLDPLDGLNDPLGKARTLDISDARAVVTGGVPMTPVARTTYMAVPTDQFIATWAHTGIFLNSQTLEVSIATTPLLRGALLQILSEQGFGRTRMARIAAWQTGTPVDASQLLAMIADIGKGRLSSKLAARLAAGLRPPAYIEQAIRKIAADV